MRNLPRLECVELRSNEDFLGDSGKKLKILRFLLVIKPSFRVERSWGFIRLSLDRIPVECLGLRLLELFLDVRGREFELNRKFLAFSIRILFILIILTGIRECGWGGFGFRI